MLPQWKPHFQCTGSMLRTMFSEKGGSDDRVGKGIWLKLGKEIKVLKGKLTETKIFGSEDNKEKIPR
jgi:hypothetical protein